MIIRIMAVLVTGMMMTVGAESESSRHAVLEAELRKLNFHPAGDIDERLPHVLLIGDSILGGYRGHVVTGLKSRANVDHWQTGAHLNSRGLHEQLKAIVSYRNYDIIHFNIGLHGWQVGRIPKGQYGDLLRHYIGILKKNATGAHLIWASTTQVHEEGKPQHNMDINPTIVYRNNLASLVMVEEKVQINDLYQLMDDKLDLVRGDRFHWKPAAYRIMGNQIVHYIEEALSD